MGMAYLSAHRKGFKYLDINGTDGRPLNNFPRDFKQTNVPKSIKLSSSSSASGSPSTKPFSDRRHNKKGKLHNDKHTVALKSYFANLLPAIGSSDISNTLISCTAFLIQTIKSSKGTEHPVEALLDGGDLAENFISQDTFIRLGGRTANSVDGLRLPIYSGLNNRRIDISLIDHTLNNSFITENLNNNFDSSVFSFSAQFRILPRLLSIQSSARTQ
jgi:hypothetical protein